MAFYMIKAGGLAGAGTDDGRYATQQTGPFSGLASYYPDLATAFAALTPPGPGDFLDFSNLHAETSSVQITILGSTVYNEDVINIRSVDDANCENLSTTTRASIETDTNANIILDGNLALHMVEIGSARDIHFNNTSYILAYSSRFVLGQTWTGGVNWRPYAASYIECHDCEFHATNANVENRYRVADSSITRLYGGTFTMGGASSSNRIIQMEGGEFEAYGVDFENWNATYLVYMRAGSGSDQGGNVVLDGCCIPQPNLDLIYRDAQVMPGQSVLLTRCAPGTPNYAANEYQWLYAKAEGQAEVVTANYRDNSAAFKSGQKVSLKVTTFANTSKSQPFRFPLPFGYIPFTDPASDTMTVFFTVDDAAAWYASDYFVDGYFRDSVDFGYKEITTRPQNWQTADEGLLPPSSETWTFGGEGPGANQTNYDIILDTSGSPGADGSPILHGNITAPNATLYTCGTLGLS